MAKCTGLALGVGAGDARTELDEIDKTIILRLTKLVLIFVLVYQVGVHPVQSLYPLKVCN